MDSASELKQLVEEELRLEEDGDMLLTTDLVCFLLTEETNAEFLKSSTTRMDILLSELMDKSCTLVETTKELAHILLRRLDLRTKDGVLFTLMLQSLSKRKEDGHSMLDINSTFKDHSESLLDLSQRE